MSLTSPRPSSRPPDSGSRRRRKTLAVLLDHMNFTGGAYENQIRSSLEARASALDINLVIFYGRGLYEPNPACAPHNAVFDLVHRDRFDGVIAVSSVLTSSCGVERFIPFLQRYRPLPVCSVGVAVPGVPSLVVDNALGIAEIVTHLVKVHGRRRIAFVAGPSVSPESQIRLEAYRKALAAAGITAVPELILEGNFTGRSASVAVKRLLDSKLPFDAVVAANDEMALGAIHVLREHGLRVPRDVAVTGFDDLRRARLGSPPVTTVAQPFEELAARAIDIILRQCAGESVADAASCATRVMLRRSCGCAGVATPVRDVAGPEMGPAAFLREHRSRILRELRAAADPAWSTSERDIDALITALERELEGEAGAFADALESTLEAAPDNDRFRAIHLAMTQLRAGLYGATTLRLEQVWFDALDLLALYNTTAQMEHGLELDEHYMQLLSFGERSSMAFDLPSLRSALEAGIPTLGVKTAFVSRFTDESATQLEPLVCLLDGQVLAPPAVVFPAHQLLPSGFDVDSPERRRTLLAFPLSFEAQRLGVAVFDYAPDRNMYGTIRDQISNTLRIVSLHQSLVHQTMLHERSVQERLATTHRIHSLSLLAGGVAHDLNNTLGPVVALPELISSQLERVENVPAIVREDLQSIHVASLRASQTIKDLLTLGRQGRTPRRPTDLCEVIRSCLGPDFCRPLEAQHRYVQIRLVLPDTPLVVQGSESHIARAVTNLVLNAVEATEGPGQVVVRVAERRLATALSGYEWIEPGHYACISVADTGHGMRSEDLSRVFEPFFSKKRAGDRSGSGLGLAIVHGVVKEHHGFVDVQSQVGAGTTFTLFLPLTEQHAELDGGSAPAPRGSARILMVDDDPIQLRTARRVLVHLGYEVTTLGSGREALMLLRQAQGGASSGFDLLILDMLLNEDRDGLDVLESVQQLFPAQKAILVSGHAPSERAERAAGHGVKWLSKPFTVESLAQAVSAVLGSPPSQEPQRVAG